MCTTFNFSSPSCLSKIVTYYLLCCIADSSGSKASLAQINHHQGGTDIPQVAENMKQQTLFDKLPDVCFTLLSTKYSDTSNSLS